MLRNGAFEEVLWKNVQIGEIVKVKNRTYIPADLILISSSEAQGTCYIETANLDGYVVLQQIMTQILIRFSSSFHRVVSLTMLCRETNLKIRQAIPETANMTSIELLSRLNDCKLLCDKPNNRLYKFDGSIALNGKVYSLEATQTLLRVRSQISEFVK